MEILYTESRSNGTSSAMETEVGLLIIFGNKHSKEAEIVFKTRNLTKTLIKIKASNRRNSIFGLTPRPLIKPCFLSSCHIPTSLISGSDQTNHGLNMIKLLPLTTCIKHGTAGFLPLDYVRKLPEYTCTIYKHPVFKIVHCFEDCVLEFPRNYQLMWGSSARQRFQEDYVKKCYQCYRKLSSRKDIFMYRDNPFCCTDCRYKASVTHYWYKRMMKAMAKNNENSPVSSMDGGSIFSIY
ncbi:hypothetical protein CDL12_27096 [Handroanthus impetiginosus]|uniref:FLZ-type domain-containing protein n=1 Tax=Handroanthus impetiginosus TaxID=429701 RepID=A0A2G9G506_9LAMI|nr:hypothetical protein CDL12_27096 [Handroanthus impetiginosus]